MSSARRAARAGRSLLLALVLGAAIIVAIVVAYVAGQGSSHPDSNPTAAASQRPATSQSVQAADTAPTGCLGGTTRDDAMLVRAQAAAPHSAYGAVEVASSFFRWAYRYPYPSRAEAAEVSKAVISSEASDTFKSIAAGYANTADITSGQVAQGTAFHITTTTGVWLVDSGSAEDRVTVELSAPIVVHDEVSATKSAAMSATLVWDAGKWRVLSQQAPDVSALSAGGTQFTAGC